MGTIYITTNVRYVNTQQSASFTRNNCAEGYTGSEVEYVVIAGTHSSDLSQLAANQLAIDDINSNGQAYANSIGECIEDARFYNTEQSDTFTRNNCSAGFYGTDVVYTIPAGTHYTYTSVDDANDLALAALAAGGQAYANANGICVEEDSWVNAEQSDTFTKDDCEEGYVGEEVLYIVAAGTYDSLISQEDADDQALADIAANGQDYANDEGECSAVTVGNTIQSDDFVKNDCEDEDYSGSIVTYTVPANTHFAFTQEDADNLALDDIAENGQDYANANGDCIQTTFWNEEQSDEFQRDNCAEDFSGSFVIYTIAAHTYSASSLIAANALAMAAVAAGGQAYANSHGSCTRTTFWNQEQSAVFQKDDCTGANTGSNVLYTVPAHTYSSSVSVEDANDDALADITANGQDFANDEGVCLPNNIVNTFTVDFGGSTTFDFCMYIDTVGVSESSSIVARDGLNFFPLATPPAVCNMLASDNFNSSGITRRFEGNIGKLEADYPDAGAIPIFTFKIRGRAATAVPAATVRWVKKGADQGNMTMTEATPGVHIPSVDNPSNNGIVNTTTSVPGSGNGTIGVGIGSVVLTLTYTRATKALVVTTV